MSSVQVAALSIMAGMGEIYIAGGIDSMTHISLPVVTPDTDFDWDELILDRGFWSWRFAGEASLSLGRQDIIWPGGFLMLEGHPYDGSRSIYHDALRLRAQPGGWRTDLALIHNEKYDPLIIAGDQMNDCWGVDSISSGRLPHVFSM